MRVWIGILGLAVAVGLAWWFLRDAEEPAPVSPLADEEVVADEHAAPVLEGSGAAAPAPSAIDEGRFPITGIVVDENDEPVADVPLELWRSTETWPGQGYDAVLQANVARVRSRASALLAGRDKSDEKIATGVSGNDGRFAFRVDVAQYHTIYARPAPPAVGTRGTAYLIEGMRDSAEVKLRVVSGVSLRGRVEDASGKPVAAQVRATTSKHPWTAYAESDADGFTIAAVPEAKLDFVITLAAGRQYSGFSATPPFRDVVLKLPRAGATIQGTVRDAGGAPVGGALVNLHLKRPGPDPKKRPTVELAAKTGADGGFEFPGVPAGEITYTAAYAGGFLAQSQYAGRAGFAAVAVPEDGAATVDLVLRRGSVVHGRVTSKEDNAPIEGATVTLYFRGWHPPQESTRTTGADGGYRFEGVGDGKFMLLASHPQHYSPEIEAARAQGYGSQRNPPPHLSVVFEKDDAKVERNLVLSRGVRMSGVVLGPDEKPVAGAKVVLQGHGLRSVGGQWGMGFHGMDPSVAVSGDDGRFVIDGLPPRTDWILYARKVGTAGIYTEPISLAEGPRDDVIVRLAKQCVVRGRVLDAGGEPLAGREIYVTGYSTLRGGPWKFISKDDGSFELHSLPASQLNLSTTYEKQRVETKVEGLTAGEVREDVLLQFGKHVEITGTVRTSKGDPVPGILVATLRQDGLHETREAQTAANGAFSIKSVTPGRVMLCVVRNRRREPVTKAFDVPGAPVDITYDPPPIVTVEGRVFGPDGAPLPIGTVQSWSSDGKQTQPQEFRDGTFRIKAPGKPPYSVSVTKPRAADGTPLGAQPGYARISDPSQAITIRLEAGVGLSGRVVDTNGKGIVGVRIRAGSADVRTDLEGHWRLAGLEPGRVALRIVPPQGFIPPAPRVVDAGTEGITVKLERGVSIGGTVSLPEGLESSGGTVTARWPRQGAYGPGRVSGRIQGGAFTLAGIPPGAVARLEARLWHSQDSTLRAAPVTLEGVAAGRKDVVLEFAAGVSVSGIVVRADGTPVTEGGVSLQDGLTNHGYGPLGTDGRFEVSGLRAGTYRLLVFPGARIGGEVTAPATGVRVVLPEQGAISGRLVDVPPDEAWVVVPVDPQTGDPAPNVRSKVRPDGSWTLDAVDKGRAWVVIARRDDGASDRYARSAPVEAGRADVALELETGRSISGRVLHQGSGVSECSVQVVAAGWSSFTGTDADGAFTLRGVPPGRYRLNARNFTIGAQGSREGVDAGSAGIEIELRR